MLDPGVTLFGECGHPTFYVHPLTVLLATICDRALIISVESPRCLVFTDSIPTKNVSNRVDAEWPAVRAFYVKWSANPSAPQVLPVLRVCVCCREEYRMQHMIST